VQRQACTPGPTCRAKTIHRRRSGGQCGIATPQFGETDWSLLFRDRQGVPPNPWLQSMKVKLAAFVELHQELEGVQIVEVEAEAVNTQESSGNRDGGPLVSVNKWVVLREAFQQGRGFFDDIAVIAALRPAQCCFQGSLVAHTLCPTEQLD